MAEREDYDLQAAMEELDSNIVIGEDSSLADKEPEPESQPQEPEQEPEAEKQEQEQEPNEDLGYVSREEYQSLRNELELYRQQTQQLAQRPVEPRQPVKPKEEQQQLAQKPQPTVLVDENGNEYEDPLYKAYEAQSKELEAVKKQLGQLSQGYASSGSMQMRQAAASAHQEMRNEYPDFDELVPEARVHHAIETAEKQSRQTGQWNYDWKSALMQAYAPLALPKMNKARAQKDELAQQRAKRDEQAQAASAVPAQGSSYQAPREIKHNSIERGYESATKAAEQDLLEALGG